MQYGSGEYDVRRALESYPAPRVRPEAVEIADRHRGMGMKTCMDMPKRSTFGRQQAQSMNVTQTNGPMRHMGIRSPILVDPTYNGGKYSNRSVRPVPRVKPEAQDVAIKAKGSMDVVMGQYGKPDPVYYGESRGAENINPKEGPLRKAGVKGPILVDPIYNKGQYTGRSPKPVPRVKSEASEIAEKHKGCIQNLLKTPDVRQFTQAKPKKQPVDHGEANVRRMRQIQKQSRNKEKEKEQNKPTPVKALWKSTRYESVESKVKTTFEPTPRAPRGVPPRPGSAPPSYDRPSSAPAGGRQNADRHTGQRARYSETPLTPKRQAERRAEDFIARNARLAKSYKPQRSKSQMEVDRSQEKYYDGIKKYNNTVKGSSPSYLQARQREWARAEQNRIRNIPDPTVPDGHTVLPDRDRKDTLNILRQSQLDLLQEYRFLPVRSADSFGVRQRKTELERRIAEVDEAVRVFERPRVFVKMDE
ncbi:enkurin domain-containing protein 1-like isoform X1 [Styela clava]